MAMHAISSQFIIEGAGGWDVSFFIIHCKHLAITVHHRTH